MGLNFYFGRDQGDDSSETTADPHGHRGLLFEVLRELSDVTRAHVEGSNGSTVIRMRTPDDDLRRIHEFIRDNVPPERMNGFSREIENHSRETKNALTMTKAEAQSVEAHVLAVTLRLNAVVRALLVATATGNEPDIQQDEFETDARGEAIEEISDESHEPDEWDDWLETHPEDAIVAEEDEDEECQPWRESIEHWRPDDEEGDDAIDLPPGESGGLFLRTPSPEEIDPETETLILAEAAEMIVDMDMIIQSFLDMQKEYGTIRQEYPNVPDLREEYTNVIIDVMRHISSASNGKTNLECVAIELGSEKVLNLMQGLNEFERVGCVDSVFHNIAETALMQVEQYSDIVNASSLGDDEENDAKMELTLTLIQRLRERLGLA